MSPSKQVCSSSDWPFTRSEELQAFRRDIKQIRESRRSDWDWTRRLVRPPQLLETLLEMERRVRESSYSPGLQKIVLRAIRRESGRGEAGGLQVNIQDLTGYPPTKALRVLCLLFDVGRGNRVKTKEEISRGGAIEDLLKQSSNPYDILRQVPAPSLLDIGAGDLTFEEELVKNCEPWLRQSGQTLLLHALDRLRPGSELGGRYHADQVRQQFLKNVPSTLLQYQFWGGVNLLDVPTLKGLLPQYTIVTCHAPATPTFAYEPTRLAQATITSALTKTKGVFRKISWGGEMALEVKEGGRTYNFPDWKFEILGPLSLLEIMAHRGELCVLSAIDSEVFWELLAQLLEDERYRPPDVVFEPRNLPEVFGSVYEELIRIPLGHSRRLEEFADLRSVFPPPRYHNPRKGSFRFRTVEIRRGAVFPGIPSSFTARQFPFLHEEDAPWWLLLVPETMQETPSQTDLKVGLWHGHR